MEFHWHAWSLYTNNLSLVKLVVLVLSLGFALLVCFFRPISEVRVLETPMISLPPAPIYEQEHSLEPAPQKGLAFQINGVEQCDLFKGQWVPDLSGPVYTNNSCPFIESHQSCMKNGRPDSGYLYWRWNPNGCRLPPFDAKRFLELMRNRQWVVIGDSISRNHVQSLLCMLSEVEQAVEVYHDEEYRSKRWHFPSHNLTVSVIWSPFLTKAAIFEDMNGVSTSEAELQLDKIDSTWADPYKSADYIIISAGQWFLKSAIYYENDTISGCHSCRNKNITELGFDYAYRKVLRHVLDFVLSSKHRGLTFFRTSIPDHFEHGEWFEGGSCERTAPVREGKVELKEVSKILLSIELEIFNEAVSRAPLSDVNLRLLNLTNLMLLRPDGHPGPYRESYPFANNRSAEGPKDCLHWCLPGPIDCWNDILMQMVIDS